MAKCMQDTQTHMVLRVSDEEADRMHKIGWKYISKAEYQATLAKRARKESA